MKTANREKIVEFCSDYLQVKDFEDYCFNGLQIEGSEKVSKIVCGVSLSERFMQEAISRKAQMLLVHHGIFGNDIPAPISLKGVMKDRIKMLLENDLNLVGYHLPLDAHPKIGNNISIAKMLGVKNNKPFSVGFVGELEATMKLEELVTLVDEKLNAKSFVLDYGKEKVKKVAIISGGSSPEFEKAYNLGADVFICGDIREEVVRKVEEVGINLINAGHYNTEKEGVKNLGKLVAKKFGIEAEFVEIPNKF